MSASVPEIVAVLTTDLVGSTAMADRVGPAAVEELRIEHFRLAGWGAGVERFATRPRAGLLTQVPMHR